MKRNKWIIFALSFPILCFIALIGYQEFGIRTGKTVYLKVNGYDPRDLLSGHYLIYTVDYGINNPCKSQPHRKKVFICLDTKTIWTYKPKASQCGLFIQGMCKHQRFTANIEKFYIPELEAIKLQKQLMESENAQIKVKVSGSGSARVVDFIL